MPTITLREARANLAELVHRLAPAEGVTITENDRPVARLVTLPAAERHPWLPIPPGPPQPTP